MISQDTAADLLRSLCYLGGEPQADAAVPAAGHGFEVDFDSKLVWPDCPFDTSAADNCYAESSRPAMLGIIGSAMALMQGRALKASAVVNEHLDHAVVRQARALEGASSSSNRAFVGYCTLTNIDASPDPVHVCVEALVHESMHQYMYRTELAHGDFCDLAETRRFRSPWSGSRIPLHSVVHASFVWFGLSTLWTQLALTAGNRDEALRISDRLSASLFGFTFLPELLHSRGFPRAGVQPQILAVMEHMAGMAPAVAQVPRDRRTLGETLHPSDDACRAWAAHVGAVLGSSSIAGHRGAIAPSHPSGSLHADRGRRSLS